MNTKKAYPQTLILKIQEILGSRSSENWEQFIGQSGKVLFFSALRPETIIITEQSDGSYEIRTRFEDSVFIEFLDDAIMQLNGIGRSFPNEEAVLAYIYTTPAECAGSRPVAEEYAF